MLLSLRRTVFASVLLGSLIFVQVCCADDIRKMVDNGDDAQKFVWVILSEGYRAQEADTFREDAQDLIDAFLAATPFKEYQSAINIYTLFRASDQSGADHPSQGVYIETAFHATFDSYGMARLLTVDSSAAFNAAMQIPHFDVVFAVVNDDQYGGSGGSVIAVSTHASSNEIALHEAGHVIGKLADEYETPYPGYPAGDPEPNVTYQSQKKNIPWSAWIDDLTQVPTPDLTLNTVGLFEGARYIADGIYRPTFTSKMRSLNQPFYEVNTEALILRIYDYVNPIQETGPQETLVALSPGAASKFWVDTIAVDTFDILWEVDGQVLENEAGATFAMLPSAVKQGRHTVSVWVSDVTDLVRADTEDVLTARQTWEVEKAFCSGQLKVSAFDAQTGEVLAAEAEALTSDITQAAADGSIVFDDLACGSQQLIVEAEGYVPAEQEVSIADGKTAGLTVRLERLDLPEPVGEALYISGTISGDVKAGVGIALVEDAGMTVIAGADGSFRLGPVGPGTYTVKPQLAGYRFSPRSRTVTLSGSGSGAVAFSMRRMGLFFFITGRVQGAVVSGIDISASGAKKAVTTTDSQGTFVLEDLPPGDYVLKPRMLGALFEPAEIALTLPVDDDAAPELSFRVKEMACAASQAAAQGSENLTKLRQLRDRVLSKSSSGRRYISLYYLASPEIVKLLRQNQSLRTEAAALLMAVLPAVDRLLNGQPADVPAATHGRLTAFIENLSRTGSPVLQKIMQRFLADLRDKKFLESLTE